MIRKFDIAFYVAAFAIAIATVAGAAPTPEPAPMGALPADLVRSIIETWTQEQIDAESQNGDGNTRYEVAARWQGDILLDVPGQVDFEVKRMSSRPFRGPTVVRVELYVDGQLDRSMAVTVDCRFYREVVVTTRSMRRGNLLESDVLMMEERDITRLKHGWFDSLDELLDLQSARPIGVGQTVSHRHVQPVPVVHRGDDISMAVTTGTMSLLVTGVAMQDGGIGERIRVRNIESGKVVFGEILDAGTIRITGS